MPSTLSAFLSDRRRKSNQPSVPNSGSASPATPATLKDLEGNHGGRVGQRQTFLPHELVQGRMKLVQRYHQGQPVVVKPQQRFRKEKFSSRAGGYNPMIFFSHLSILGKNV